MDFDQVMWGNKKFSDLLKDIYNNSKEILWLTRVKSWITMRIQEMLVN